jgi:hypothetical protein
MNKKQNTLRGGLQSLIKTAGTQPAAPEKKERNGKQPGRPRTYSREITKTSQAGVQGGYCRATYIVKESYIKRFKEIAYINRQSVKELAEQMFSDFLQAHKKDKL